VRSQDRAPEHKKAVKLLAKKEATRKEVLFTSWVRVAGSTPVGPVIFLKIICYFLKTLLIALFSFLNRT